MKKFSPEDEKTVALIADLKWCFWAMLRFLML